MRKSIFIRKRGDDYEIEFWFYGKTWHLKTVGHNHNWMIRSNQSMVLVPLKHSWDCQRQMTSGDDSTISALTQVKFQLFKLRYGISTPTFHEQYSHYFPTSHDMASDSEKSDQLISRTANGN